MQKLIS